MLHLPWRVLTDSIRTMADCGKGRCECVAYWTGPISDDGAVDGWTHPSHRRSPFGYQIEDNWLTKFWFQLAAENRAIRAQVHTHPGSAFHSETDDNWPVVSQAGFVSVVVPNFALEPINLKTWWAGVLAADGSWKEVSIASLLEVTGEKRT
jgi:hypothetical protein